MHKKSLIMALLVVVLGVASIQAQSQLEILSVEEPDWSWGSQAIQLKVRNHGEYVRFIVITTEFLSSGTDGVWQVKSRFSSMVDPDKVTALAPVVSIPGNYGSATVRLSCYDVVDTLDVVLPGQKLNDTTFSFAIEMPETAREWVDKNLILPPRVEQHLYFDDEFSRLLIKFIAAGKPIEEMTRICGAKGTYIRSVLHRMRRHGLVRFGETALELTFPYITSEEATACAPLAHKTAGLLAETISANLVGYEERLDSLVKAGLVPDDRDNLINGTMLLYQPFVMVSAMLMWYDLGSLFVTDGKPLRVFEGTDICNASNVNFMYAVEGDESLTGHHLFAALARRDGEGILFADHVPIVVCSGNYPARPGVPARATFSHDPNDRPEFFFMDTTIARPVLEFLDRGTDLILSETNEALTGLTGHHGRSELTPAFKYWFWNIVATKTLDLLLEKKALQGRGTNHFQLGSVTGM